MSRMCAALLLSTVLFLSTSVRASSPRAALAVHVVDYAAVSNNEIARAEQEAARLWSHIDVSLTWTIGDAGVKPRAATDAARALDVTLLLLNQDMAQRMIAQEHRGPGVLARAVPEALRVYVFYDRVRTESERYSDLRGVILGRVVAHEFGHLLLGHTHSASSLFRAEPDLGSARLAFGDREGEAIRSGILSLMAGTTGRN